MKTKQWLRVGILGLVLSSLLVFGHLHPGTTIASGKKIDGFGMGSGTHLRVGVQGLQTAFDAQANMGVRWNREDIPWGEVEPTPGVFRWAYEFGDHPRDFDLALTEMEKHNIEMVALLVYGPAYLPEPMPDELVAYWANYVQAIVDEFGDRIDYWEIGNEMNSRQFWAKVVSPTQPVASAEPDPELYTRMLRTAYEIIKEHNPQDTVILGGLVYDLGFDCPTNPFAYLARLHAAGAWDFFDVMAIHPYRSQPPEMFLDRLNAYDPESDTCLSDQVLHYNLVGEMRALRALMSQYGNKPIWVTEIGWDQPWLQEWAGYRGVSPEQVEADFLVRTYVPLLAEPGVEKVFWYTQYEDASGISFQLDEPGQRALHIAATLLTGSKSLGQFQGQDDRGDAESDDVYEYRFRSDRGVVIVIWKARGGDTARAVTIADLEDVESLLAYDLRATDLSAEAGHHIAVEEGQAVIQLTESPLFLVYEETALWDKIWRSLEAWWEEQQVRLEDWWEEQLTRFEDWWEEQQAKVEDWWEERQEEFEEWSAEKRQEIERELEVWFEEEFQRMIAEICGTAYLPLFALTAIILIKRHQH